MLNIKKNGLMMRNLFYLMIFSVFFLVLSGCAQRTGLYYWGEYETCLSKHYLNNDDESSFEYLKNIITNAETNNYKVAPGIYAEYGFFLYQQKQPTLAVEYFKKEAQAFPESQVLMHKLITTIEKQQQKKDDAKPDEAPATTKENSSQGGNQ